MADFRLSAQIIKRSSGRSATAAAAYRAAERIMDERTGDRHNYTRKAGVLVAEIHAPANAPEWMRDRSTLWNAVEQSEKRKDAQVAREVQLSLPHELTHEQRLKLVRDYVADAFVSRGMVADVCIHAPDRKSDERNHHAHIMLTMRTVGADGFGNKERGWNAKQTVEQWREKWAKHQNRELERHGHKARVDHRSYAKRGIDKEPTQHRGQAATDMMRKGKATRIERENQDRERRNGERAKLHAVRAQIAARISHERAKLERYAEKARSKTQQRANETREKLVTRQAEERRELNHILELRNGETKATLRANLLQIENRLEKSKGLGKLLRSMTGRTKQDQTQKVELGIAIRQLERAENNSHKSLARTHKQEQSKANKKIKTLERTTERNIKQAKERQSKSEERDKGSLKKQWTRKSEKQSQKATKAAKPTKKPAATRTPR